MSVTDAKTLPKDFDAKNAQRALELARDTIQIEADALLALKARLTDSPDESFAQAMALLLRCSGRVVVSGIGKSGHIARKIAATLASTGTPALFVHAAEALHGDLGMITENDVVIAISYSGEAAEFVSIIPIIKRMGAKLIAITGNDTSRLAQLADVHLNVRVDKEACPLNLAPTASTTATLALGDALAVALLDGCACGGIARCPRIPGRGFRPLPPGRRARPPPADTCTRCDAYRRRDPVGQA
jgi:arabinose-5-phosphate isomerase